MHLPSACTDPSSLCANRKKHTQILYSFLTHICIPLDIGEHSNLSHRRNKRWERIAIRASQKYQKFEKVGMREKWIFQMKSQMKDGCYLSPRQRQERGRLKEIHLHQDSRSSNLVILQEVEKYGVRTGDILPHKKGMLRLKRITDLQTSSLSI